jgi:hypothetical protein
VPDTRAPAFNAKGASQSIYDPVTLDDQDPQSAVFVFWEKGNFVASGFESKWLTVR